MDNRVAYTLRLIVYDLRSVQHCSSHVCFEELFTVSTCDVGSSE